ncbi:MAG TPA: alpha/beta hydrolase [Myxococcota bacterium]
MKQPLTLEEDDPRVVAARNAEAALFADLGIGAREHEVLLAEHGIKVRVLEIGNPDDEPVLVMPGNTGDVFPMSSLLSGFFGKRLICVNRPGGGLSEGLDHGAVDDLRRFVVTTVGAVLDALAIERVDVVAHSMGAHWSLWFAIDRPQRVRRLALLGGPGNVLGAKPPLLLRVLAVSPFGGRLLAKFTAPKDADGALEPLTKMGHTAETLAKQPATLADAYFAFRQLPHYATSLTTMTKNPPAHIDAAELARVPQPTLLVLGSADTFATLEEGQKIVDALPNGTFAPIDNAGHLPWLDAPEICSSLIQLFFSTADVPVVDFER